jgi:hypothetical protein
MCITRWHPHFITSGAYVEQMTTPLSYMTIQRYVPCHVFYDSSNMTLDHLVICILYDYNIIIDRVIYFLFSYSEGIQIKIHLMKF